MEQTLTYICKFLPTEEQAKHLNDTLSVFADACNWIHETVPKRIRNYERMNGLVYYETRERCGLSSNLTQQAIRRVCANRKAAHTNKTKVVEFDASSIQYDARIFSLREPDWTVSLTLLHSRERFALMMGDYQREKLAGKTSTSAQLCRYRDGSYAIHIQIKVETKPPAPTDKAIGVDLGRTDIAFTSRGKSWSGEEIRRVRDHYSRLRAALERKATKGTRSTRRRCRQLLKRLSGREKRFQRLTNHEMSKNIVETAQGEGAMVVLEDLTGIRERTNKERRKKVERRRSNAWAFYQLRLFLAYKANLASVPVVLHDPRYTSQMCSSCLHLGQRSGKRFSCQNCGHSDDADPNAAKNLEILGLNVTRPRGPWIHCTWSGQPAGLLK
jgi:IS605 OrfB family transposase